MFIYKKYNTLCEEMETDAVYTIAKNFNVPVIGIRVITNNEVLKETYDKEFAKEIAVKCQEYVEKITREVIRRIESI